MSPSCSSSKGCVLTMYIMSLTCRKLQAQFQSMEVRNSSFAAFIDAFTPNTFIMVITSDPSVRECTNGNCAVFNYCPIIEQSCSCKEHAYLQGVFQWQSLSTATEWSLCMLRSIGWVRSPAAPPVFPFATEWIPCTFKLFSCVLAKKWTIFRNNILF